MLVKFSVTNYKVFRSRAELSLIASNYDKASNVDTVIDVPKFGLRLLKSAVVYGANASGKSKLIDALTFMREFVEKSFSESQKGDKIGVAPFRLSAVSEFEPSEFEAIFIHNDVLYRYGFEITSDVVVSEWLYHRQHTKEVELFYREGQQIEHHRRSFSASVNQYIKDNSIRENALLLSALAATFNDPIAGEVLTWFNQIDIPPVILRERTYLEYTDRKLRDPAFKSQLLSLLSIADLGIQDIIQTEEKEGFWNSLAKIFNTGIQTAHAKYDEKGQLVGNELFSLDEDESEGTQKFLAMTGPILDSLSKGSIFVADELDAKLHANLVAAIIELFHSPKTNPNNAQLIFNTHNTNLLNSGTFRRDQIWFVEKDRYGAAKLYSLADFKMRSNKNFEADYVEGKYGAVPYLGPFARYVGQPLTPANEGAAE